MSAAQHTPGPWEAEPADFFGDHNINRSDSADALVVAVAVNNMRPADTVAANARLVAAAPELLDANQAALTLVCDLLSGVGVTDERLNHVGAQLALAKKKATGA